MEASTDVTWRAGCSLSSTQLQCHLKVDPPQLQHFLSDGLGEEHPLVSRFYILSGDFFFNLNHLSLCHSPPLSAEAQKIFFFTRMLYSLYPNFRRRLVNTKSTIKLPFLLLQIQTFFLRNVASNSADPKKWRQTEMPTTAAAAGKT